MNELPEDAEVIGASARTDLAWSRSGLALAVAAAAILKVVVHVTDYRDSVIVFAVLVAAGAAWALSFAHGRVIAGVRSKAAWNTISASCARSPSSRSCSRSAHSLSRSCPCTEARRDARSDAEYGRHGWPRSDGHAGRPGGTRDPRHDREHDA